MENSKILFSQFFSVGFENYFQHKTTENNIHVSSDLKFKDKDVQQKLTTTKFR